MSPGLLYNFHGEYSHHLSNTIFKSRFFSFVKIKIPHSTTFVSDIIFYSVRCYRFSYYHNYINFFCYNNLSWHFLTGFYIPKVWQTLKHFLGAFHQVRIGLPLALSEPEPTRPFGLSLSEPTNRHLPYLLIIMHVFSKQVTMKKKEK